MFTAARRLVFACVALLGARATMSQELIPRAYTVAPEGANALTVGYSHLNGDLLFDGAVPITDATADINLTALGFYRSLDVLGRTANVAVGIPYGIGDFNGTVADVPRHAHRSGFLDSFVRFSVNLIGAPAMEPAQFLKWQQDVLLGVSLKIVAPTGQYDSTRLINWGNNRWAFKPEIGYSQRWGHWVLDAYGALWLFTGNNDFFRHQSQSESPVGALETHLSYDLGMRAWVSLDANFWWGGETSLNGIPNPSTRQKNSRVGFTASIPFTRHQSVKLSYSNGAYIAYGGNYQNISLTWQYSWVDP
jgi:hypothetical protein